MTGHLERVGPEVVQFWKSKRDPPFVEPVGAVRTSQQPHRPEPLPRTSQDECLASHGTVTRDLLCSHNVGSLKAGAGPRRSGEMKSRVLCASRLSRRPCAAPPARYQARLCARRAARTRARSTSRKRRRRRARRTQSPPHRLPPPLPSGSASDQAHGDDRKWDRRSRGVPERNHGRIPFDSSLVFVAVSAARVPSSTSLRTRPRITRPVNPLKPSDRLRLTVTSQNPGPRAGSGSRTRSSSAVQKSWLEYSIFDATTV